MQIIAPMALTVVMAVHAQTDPPVHECDRLAASPFDPEARAAGLRFEKIDAKKAERACRDAIREYPETARFHLQLGRTYVAKKKHNDALEEFREAIRLDPEYGAAMLSLGTSYANGWWFEENWKEAVGWWRNAVEFGAEGGGRSNLGVAYTDGRGVERDYEEAARWFREPAEQGDALSQYYLGWMSEWGLGVDRDGVEAAKWYRLAAQQGFASAQSGLAGKYLAGSGVEKDYGEAMRWQNDKEALRYYNLAADRGLARAQNSLGVAYYLERAQIALDDLYAAGLASPPPPDWLGVGSSCQIFFEDKPLIPEPLVATGEFGKGSHASTTKIPIRAKAEPGTYKYVVTVEGAETVESKQALFVVREPES